MATSDKARVPEDTERRPPEFVGFQMPNFAGAVANKQWPKPADGGQMMEVPKFVVFEVASWQNGQQQKMAKVPRGRPMPFLPLGHSPKALMELKRPTPPISSQEEEVEQQQIHFTMAQLGGQQQQRSMPATSGGGHSRPNGRLLFDNPMFRRLPNWHFFGDDRRLASIPPVIPLLRIPVERTLLSIAPSLSWTRQLLLLGLLDLKSIRCCTAQAALDWGPMDKEEEEEAEMEEAITDGEEDEEEESLPPCSSCSEAEEASLPPDSGGGGCPSSSGVESMSSGETTANTPTEGGSTPLRAMTPERCDGASDDGKPKEEEEGQKKDYSDSPNDLTAVELSSSGANSVSSSTPNSPPTFDRRTVRMSRASRDAVLRLSISRRFCDDNDEEAPTTDEHMMALRIRHVSNASTKSNERSTLPLDQNQSKPPFTSGGISCMDVLSERIYNFHQNIEQSHYQMNRKLMLRDQLYYAISPIFPLCGLYIVGSSLNGFGTSRSDLDLCLMITSRDIDQRSDAIVILTAVTEALKHNKIVVDQQLIAAKVPILRIKCSGVYADIMVDLNVNNSVAIRNTHLLCYYSAFDWRVRPIVMVVKEWAKRRGINNASRSTFTSYSLVLMVIHYLQCGASPPVLPSLQQLYSQRFSDKLDVRQLNVSQPLDPQPSDLWSFDQRLSLSELLLGFLKYYAFDFNFDRDAISIRLGRKLERSQVTQNQSPFNSLSQWHCICIEEPFTLSNAAHSVYDGRIFQEIKKTFAECYTELDENRDLDGFLGKTIAEENENGPEIAQPAMNGNDNNNMRDELA